MIGAIVGFLVFLAVGALHTVNFAAQMGLLLAGVVFGQPVEPGIGSRLFIAGSITVSAVAVASLFAVLGSLVGLVVGGLAKHVKFGRESDDEPMIVIERNGD
jgi:hypothetical protein